MQCSKFSHRTDSDGSTGREQRSSMRVDVSGVEVLERMCAWGGAKTDAAEELREAMRPMVNRQRELARELGYRFG